MVGASEFWQMTPWQVWWVIEDNMPDELPSMMMQSDIDELNMMIAKAKRDEQNG